MDRHSNPIDEFVGSRLRNKRAAIGWSQKRLAETLRIDPKDIKAYEGARSASALITCSAFHKSWLCGRRTSSSLKMGHALTPTRAGKRPCPTRDCASIGLSLASRAPSCARRSSGSWSNWRRTISIERRGRMRLTPAVRHQRQSCWAEPPARGLALREPIKDDDMNENEGRHKKPRNDEPGQGGHHRACRRAGEDLKRARRR